MYAVIRTGGKQLKVAEGQRVDVELLGAAPGEQVSFEPVLLVDGSDVVANRSQLATAAVAGVVVGESKGPKITGFTYKPKTNNRRRWGHRQRYTTVEITSISRQAGGQG